MSLQELKIQLSNDYSVIEFVDLTEYTALNELYSKLVSLKKEEYQDNERIVFFYDIHFIKIIELVQEILITVDIPEFFTIFKEGAIQRTNSLDFNFSDTQCIYPWLNLELGLLGEIRPCCTYRGNIVNNNQISSIKNSNIKEVYLSDYMKNLRESFRQGIKPKECSTCWSNEAANIPSMRQRAQYKFKEIYYKLNYQDENFDNLQLFDLKLGNSCNLSCRICSAESSSKIADSDLKAGRLTNDNYIKLQNAVAWAEADNFWDQLLPAVNNIKYLDIYGGEPLISQKHFTFLKKLIELDVAKNIKIDYNTNGTVFSEKFFELWDHFKEVKLSFSIDNIGERFELERNGVAWDIVAENIKKFNSRRSEKFITDVFPSINIQNVLYVPELLEWIDSQQFSSRVSLNIVYDPSYLSILSMTREARELVLDKLNSYADNDIIKSIINLIENSPAIDLANEFISYMKTLDVERQQNFAKTHPDIAKAMGYQ